MIKAPYNFVPLSSKVVFPEWADQISIDKPFKDGISGTIEVEYEAKTPVFIGNGKSEKDKALVHNYKSADGHYAIPGSSLRGMIRNVIEIASFGKFERVDDVIKGFRDLQNLPLYNRNEQMTKRMIDGSFEAQAKAGWLVFVNKEWILHPVNYHRVEDKTLDSLYGTGDSLQKHERNPEKRREILKSRYDVYFTHEKIPSSHEHHIDKKTGKPMLLRYSAVEEIKFNNFQSAKKGYVVVTGSVGRKHMDFVFEQKSDLEINLGKDDSPIIKGFSLANAPDAKNDQQGINLNERLRKFKGYPGIPVFYITDSKGNPSALGLAQMFRLPYKYSIHDAIKHTSPEHLNSEKMDLPECIFGKIDNNKSSLRGRVQFEDAVGKNVSLDSMVTTILGNPKPSFYPNYIEQNLRKGDYTTLMDDDVRLRGWKRYPVRNTPNPLVPENEQKQQQQKFMESSQQENSSDKKQKNQDNLITKFEPLKKNSVFEGKIHFHNLKPEELGALLWAITWNNNKELSHSIGMGKPYGFGQIKAEIKSLSFLENSTISNDYAEANVEQISSWQNKFSIFMESQISNWKDSQQLEELFAMSNPEKAERPNWDLEHMSLSDKEFTKAKGGQNNPKEYLAPYSSARQNLSLPKNGTNNSGSFSQPIRPTNIPAVDPKKLAQELATAPKEGDTVTVIVDKPPKKGVMDTHIESNKNFIVIVRDISGKFNKEWQKQGAKFKIKIFKKDSLNDKKFTALAKDAESL